MNYYTKIVPWENSRRLQRLYEFRSLVVQYFNSSRADSRGDHQAEQSKAEEARLKINRMVNEAHRIILHAGLNPVIEYTPPPAIGGYIRNIDLVQNIFYFHHFGITANDLVDVIDRAIGIYESNRRPSFLRAINPFFYIGLAFDLVARIPFIIIGSAGFNR